MYRIFKDQSSMIKSKAQKRQILHALCFQIYPRADILNIYGILNIIQKFTFKNRNIFIPSTYSIELFDSLTYRFQTPS